LNVIAFVWGAPAPAVLSRRAGLHAQPPDDATTVSEAAEQLRDCYGPGAQLEACFRAESAFLKGRFNHQEFWMDVLSLLSADHPHKTIH
jgi:hypothetical protein